MLALAHEHEELRLGCRKQAESSSYVAPHSTVASALLPVPVRELKPLEEEALLPLPKDVENLADDPQLQNPLQRSERMSTGWFGVCCSTK